QDVAREQRSEQHDLRGEEEPDADLPVGQTGVAPDLYGVGDLHRSDLVLGPEVLGSSGDAVLVRAPVRFRHAEEISVRRGRGSRPLNRRGLPWVVADLLPLPDAPEEIEDEGKLEEPEGPRAP